MEGTHFNPGQQGESTPGQVKERAAQAKGEHPGRGRLWLLGAFFLQTLLVKERTKPSSAGHGEKEALTHPSQLKAFSPQSASSPQDFCPHLTSFAPSFRFRQPDPLIAHTHSFLFSPKVVILTPVGKISRLLPGGGEEEERGEMLFVGLTPAPCPSRQGKSRSRGQARLSRFLTSGAALTPAAFHCLTKQTQT